jgi:hypothetical protein
MPEHQGELPLGSAPCVPIRPSCCLSIPVAVDLVAELELGVIEIGKMHVCQVNASSSR